MKLCKDCCWAHCLVAGGEDNPIYWQCHHDSARIISPPDPVVGLPARDEFLSCGEARLFGNLCGLDGEFWEPLPKLSTIGFGEALSE